MILWHNTNFYRKPLWKTKIYYNSIFLNLASRSNWAPPHHLHIWHSSLRVRLRLWLGHVLIAGLVSWYISRMMGKTKFLGEFASNFWNRFELAPESDNPHFFVPQKMEPSDYLKPKFGKQIVLCIKSSAFRRKMSYYFKSYFSGLISIG